MEMRFLTVLLVGCSATGGPPPGSDGVPDPGTFLNRSYGNGGLADAASAVETARYLGALPSAPETFEAWLTEFEFPRRAEGEDLESFRSRAGLVVYYNRNELALGRELGCAEGTYGVACFVTNYGDLDDESRALDLAVAGEGARNTVAITYLEDMPEAYRVQFYAYRGGEGLLDSVSLDSRGPRPLPHVCTNCHGGSFDSSASLTKYARFLPLDLDAVVFGEAPYDRVSQEEAIWRMNAMSLRTPLTDAQRDVVEGTYGGDVDSVRTSQAYVPPGWSARPDLYRDTVKPYCLTCHLAEERAPDGSVLPSHEMFDSASIFLARDLGAWVCSGDMPNAEPTLRELWKTGRLDPAFDCGGAR